MSAYDAPACFAAASAASASPFRSWFGAAKSVAAGRNAVAAPSAIMDWTNSRRSIMRRIVKEVGDGAAGMGRAVGAIREGGRRAAPRSVQVHGVETVRGRRADDFDASDRPARHEDDVAGREDRRFAVERDLDRKRVVE